MAIADRNGFGFLSPPKGPDEIGRLGPYRILKVIGKGGMGVVFLAEDLQLERTVALKVMRPEAAKKGMAKERFLREARATAKIEHDHIVTIYQVGEDRGVPFLAMQLLKGTSLEAYLVKKGNNVGAELAVDQILKLGREIAKGLAAAHDHGMIHRDIKPANIWLDATAGGRVKILDFGLARAAETESNLTQIGAVVGTAAYMAPEQARGGKIDGRADLFSLGCVLYRLCTGRMPWRSGDAVETLVTIATEEPTPIQEFNPDLLPPFANLVMSLLAKKPENRPASAKAVVEAIQEIERDGQMKAAVPAPTAIATPDRGPTSGVLARSKVPSQEMAQAGRSLVRGTGSSRRPARRRPWLLVGVLAGLALAAGTTGWVFHHKVEPSKVSAAAETANRLLEAGQIAEAKSFLDELAHTDPDIAKHPAIQEILASFQTREKEDRGRKLLFEEAVKDAEAAPLDSAGDAAVAKARGLARLAEEEAAVQRLVRLRKEKLEKAQMARDNAVIPRLRDIKEKIDRLDKMLASGDTGKAAELLGQTDVAASQLRSDARGVNENISKDIDGLFDRLGAARRILEGKNLEGTALAALTQALGNRDDLGPYFKAAERYAKEFPDRELSKALPAVLRERTQWQAVLDWNAVFKSAGTEPLLTTPKDAKVRAAACREFLAKRPNFPDAPALDAYVKCLDAHVLRDEADAKSAATEFRGIFGDQLVKDLWYVKLDDGKTYYLRESMDDRMKAATDGYVRFPYVVGRDAKDKGAVKKYDSVKKYGRALQSEIADSARAVPENFGDKSWEETVVGYAQKVRDREDMDAILQVVLLRRLINCAVRASYPLQGALADFRERIEKPGFEVDVAWVDPASKEAANVRSKAREFMSKLPSLNAALKSAIEYRQKVQTDVAQTYRVPVGWLFRGSDGRWSCRSPSGADFTALADLFVLVPATGGLGKWQRVGKMEWGKPTIDVSTGDALLDGRLVFATRAAK